MPVLTCPTCGFESPAEMLFCGMCGTRLARACPACGFHNPPQFRFCGMCGAALEPLPAGRGKDALIETARFMANRAA